MFTVHDASGTYFSGDIDINDRNIKKYNPRTYTFPRIPNFQYRLNGQLDLK